jgi:hypothetical protein
VFLLDDSLPSSVDSEQKLPNAQQNLLFAERASSAAKEEEF